MSGPRRALLPAPLPAPGTVVALSPDDSRHLCGVLRMRSGDPLEVFDGAGWQAAAVLVDADRRAATARIDSPARDLRPEHPLHLGLAVLKGQAMDDAVRMATEAGATAIHPILADRCVAIGDRADRWSRIAASAAAQCLRADTPVVHAPAPLSDVLDRLADVPVRRVAAPEAPMGEAHPAATAVLVGPAGGWTEGELSHVQQAGYAPVGLSAHVLRAPTAAAVACALLSPARATAGGRS